MWQRKTRHKWVTNLLLPAFMGIGELVAFTGTKGPFDLGEDSTGTGELGSKADEGR